MSIVADRCSLRKNRVDVNSSVQLFAGDRLSSFMPLYSFCLCRPGSTTQLSGGASNFDNLGAALTAAQHAGWSLIRKRRGRVPIGFRSSLEVTDERGVQVARIMLAELAQ